MADNPRKRRFQLLKQNKVGVAPPRASDLRLEALLDEKDGADNRNAPAKKKLKTTKKCEKAVRGGPPSSTTISNTKRTAKEAMCVGSRNTGRPKINIITKNKSSRGMNTLSGGKGLKGISRKKLGSKTNRLLDSNGKSIAIHLPSLTSRKTMSEMTDQSVAKTDETTETSSNIPVEAPQGKAIATAAEALNKTLPSDVATGAATTKPTETSALKSSLPSLGLKLSNSKTAVANKRSIQQHRHSVSSAAVSLLPSVTNKKDETTKPSKYLTAGGENSTNTQSAACSAKVPVGQAPTVEPHVSSLSNSSPVSFSSNIHISSTNNNSNKRSSKQNHNDNFVRLNLRNNAGACRGARNRKIKKRWKSRQDFQREKDYNASYAHQHSDNSDDDANAGESSNWVCNESTDKSAATSYVSKMSGLDPLDEFMDGTFRASSKHDDSDDEAPKCARHQRPCKLITVRKNTTGSKGRKFYACSMPRGEQCNHFQWADDTIEAARKVIAKNGHHSTFISRQVAEHVARFRVLTVSELREEAARRKLNKAGKKQELLMRLAIWARDELVKSAPHLDETEDNQSINIGVSKIATGQLIDLESSATDESGSNDDASSISSEEDELEFEGDSNHDNGRDDSTHGEAIADISSYSQLSNPRDSRRDDSLIESLQRIFGHKSFRNGQEWAVQRCLEGKKSLLVAPTGFGKSLCYSLPAALSDGVCIVVSPLISLIQDQLRSLPPSVPAATLSGSVCASKSAAILDDIIRKRLKILFVSPERLTSPAFRRLFNLVWDPEKKTKLRMFPDISLLCIDEAHCISQWAHNFRPSFLRFNALLRLMKPKSILGITATAGPKVVNDIRETLGIAFKDEVDSIKIVRSGRDNIDVKVKLLKNHEERLEALVGILTPDTTKRKGADYSEHAGKLSNGSVIVYVWRQKDTEVVAEYLNAAGVPGGVVIYHGGMDASARAKSQSKFMRGKARVCVATVAFGLGIDKSDIVGIVHMYLSNSPEHYLQEIGRAGRDGRKAIAIALPLTEEVPVRHSLSHSNLITKDQVRVLLRKLKATIKDSCEAIGSNTSELNRGLHIALPVQETMLDCDCKQETIETILSLIERSGGDEAVLHVEGLNYDKATVAMKKRSLKKLAKKEDVAKCILSESQCLDPPIGMPTEGTGATSTLHGSTTSFQKHFLAYSMGSYTFSIAKCANHLGPSAEPRHMFAALRRLQSFNELELHLDTSEKGRVFHVKITELGTRIFASGDYDGLEETLTNEIQNSFILSSSSSSEKVLDMHFIMHEVAAATDSMSEDNESADVKSSSLSRFQELTSSFFAEGLKEKRDEFLSEILPASFYEVREKVLVSDVRVLVHELPAIYSGQENRENNSTSVVLGQSIEYTTLAITKFLHGIESPRTPHLLCRNHPMFGRWREVKFEIVHNSVCKALEP